MVMRVWSKDHVVGMWQVWMRRLFMFLPHQPNDDLSNIAFVHAGHGGWRVAPSFGLRLCSISIASSNKAVVTGAKFTAGLRTQMEQAAEFGVHPAEVLQCLQRQLSLLANWKLLATQFFAHMGAAEIERFESAMTESLLVGSRYLLSVKVTHKRESLAS